MKRSINIKSLTVALSLVLSGAGMSGCAGFLERDNPIATTDERWWLTGGHLTNAVNDVYNNSVNSGVITYNRPQYSGSANYSWAYVNLTGLTDDGIFASNYQDWSPFTNGGATSSHRYVHEYYLKYNYIRRASRVLENYHRVKGINNKKAEDGILLKERLAAEARAMRAYLHMEMFFFFGPVPIIDHSLDVSEQNIARAGQEELVKFIVDEFELAAQNLPRAYTAESDTWRFTKGACYAFAAKTLLHVGKYSEAAGMAKLVVDMTNDDMTPVYELYIDGTNPAMSYGKMFEYAGQKCKERVFYSKGGNVQVFRRLSPASVSYGQSGICPTVALVNSYETKVGYALAELPEVETAKYIKYSHYNDDRDPRHMMVI
mgnify:CR=1 FL=1